MAHDYDIDEYSS